MYVRAPSLHSNGTLQVPTTTRFRSGVTSPNLAAARAALSLEAYTGSFSSRAGETFQANRQKGVIGYKLYKNTPFQGVYRRWSSDGLTKSIVGPTVFGEYYARIDRLGFSSIVGNNGDGIEDRLIDLSLLGVPGSIQAVYNTGVINNNLNRALSECRQKAAQQKLDIPESLSGIPQTVAMICERVTQVLRAYNALRKGNIPAALGALGLRIVQLKRLKRMDIANLWLEIQYGWLPLLNDIYDGMEYIAEALKEPAAKKSYFTVVRRLDQFSLACRDIEYATSTWFPAKRSNECWGSVEVKYKFTVASTYLAYLNTLNLVNPLYVVWVNMPFSFLIDWLIPVADMLNAFTAPIGLQFASGYATLRSWGRADIYLDGLRQSQQVSISGACTAVAERAEIRRLVYTTWPTFSPYIRFPILSTQRHLTAVSLLRASRQWR